MTRAEIQALIDAAPDGRIGFVQCSRPIVTIPYGHHVLDGPIVINKRVELDFRGGALIVPNGVRGIECLAGGWQAMVRNVTVFGQSQDYTAHGAAGIYSESYGMQFVDVMVRFCGIGLDVYGVSSEGKNANDTCGLFVKTHDCGTGIRFRGGDTNGGAFVGTTMNVGINGIDDASFLGNNFIGTMFHSLREYAYKGSSVANYSTFVGSYLELDCGADLPNGWKDTVSDTTNVTWVGGGAVTVAKLGTRVGLNRSRIRFGDTTPDGGSVAVTMPHGAVESALSAERRTAGGVTVDGFRLRWVQALKQAGIEAWKPNVAGQTPTGDGLTRPLSWTAAGNTEGFAKPKLEARHYTVGSPVGDAALRLRTLAAPPSIVTLGETILVVDINAETCVAYHGRDEGNGPYWHPLSWSVPT